jgi:cobalt-zinc-cadmium efflux system membrane fusion protein
MMKTTMTFMATLLLLIAGACSNNAVNQDSAQMESDSDIVVLTEEQMEIAGIETGKMEKRLVADVIDCTGFIDVPPTNRSTLHAPIEGIIETLNIVDGRRVKEGEELATIADQEIVKLQEEYLYMHTELVYWKSELVRKQKLYENDAISRKDFLETENKHSLANYKLQSLEKQLQLLGLEGETLLNDGISSHISIRAPFDGFIADVYVNMGMHVDENIPMVEVINYDHVHLELSVYSGEISKVEIDQRVRFRFAGSDKGGWGRVQLIGKKVDDINRSILIHAHIEKADSELTVGTSILANILCDADSVRTLPEEAILMQGEKSFVFKKDDNEFLKIPVITGRIFNGFVEIVNHEEITGEDIVTTGAYYLLD